MDLMLFDKIIAIDNLSNEIIFIVNIKAEDLETNYNLGKIDLQQMVSLINEGKPQRDGAVLFEQ